MDEIDNHKLWDDPKFREAVFQLEKTVSKPPVIKIDEARLAKGLKEQQSYFSSLQLRSDFGTAFQAKLARNIRYKYSLNPLSVEGNFYTDGRFHRKGGSIPTLYLAQDEIIAHMERRITGLDPVQPHISFWVDVSLQNVLDITDKNIDLFLDEKEKDLMMGLPYRYFNDVLDMDSFSQLLSKKCKNEGYEAILYKSVRGNGVCLAVFLDQLLRGSSLSVIGKEDFVSVDTKCLTINGIL